ncbi:MAG TPA: hypothetical protein VE109_12770, partial [Acidobacteriaceae bacterium]|nr:hypothetical protein [Acidobacteriaceae bacterium]
PRCLQGQTLLRIHSSGFSWSNLKQARIEFIHPVEKPAVPGDHLPWPVWIWIKIRIRIPAIGRHERDRIPAISKQLPERLTVTHTAGKPAADANDSDRFFGGALSPV